MADKSAKHPENAPGKFYIDDTCADCDNCRYEAPENFARNDDGCYSYICKQPENDEELQQCIAAMEGCPTESIGDDGDE